jgi:hypothetical protein
MQSCVHLVASECAGAEVSFCLLISIDCYGQLDSCRHVLCDPRLVLVWLVVVHRPPSCLFFFHEPAPSQCNLQYTLIEKKKDIQILMDLQKNSCLIGFSALLAPVNLLHTSVRSNGSTSKIPATLLSHDARLSHKPYYRSQDQNNNGLTPFRLPKYVQASSSGECKGRVKTWLFLISRQASH